MSTNSLPSIQVLRYPLLAATCFRLEKYEALAVVGASSVSTRRSERERETESQKASKCEKQVEDRRGRNR